MQEYKKALWGEIQKRNDVQQMMKMPGWKIYQDEIMSISHHLTIDGTGDKDLFTLDREKLLVSELVKRERERWINAVDDVIKRGDDAAAEYTAIISKEEQNGKSSKP